MKIAIIGSGNVGGTLGKRWAANGHSVIFGSRDPNSAEMQTLLSAAGPNASAAGLAEASAACGLVLLATPWTAAQQAIESAGNLAGKILIDATNPARPPFTAPEVGTTTSGAEQIAAWARGARVVKAFNTVGFNIMANPRFNGRAAVMFYCGDDDAAKTEVAHLVSELGFDAVDAGPLVRARLLEPFALLWISLAASGHSREIAFHFMHRS